jgi:uncharacterized protein (DUF433 family)
MERKRRKQTLGRGMTGIGGMNVVMAFNEDHVVRLTGLSKTQLRYWDRTGFFTPSYAETDRRTPYGRLYSFRDLVGLRTLSILRHKHQVPLQHLRQVAKKLSHLKDALWTKTVLFVLKRRVVIAEDGKLKEPVSGQLVLSVPLETVISDMSQASEKLRTRAPAQFGKIARNRYVAHNAPVVAGTRIPTRAISAFSEAGYTVAQIILEYPDLTVDDVKAALAHEESARAAA